MEESSLAKGWIRAMARRKQLPKLRLSDKEASSSLATFCTYARIGGQSPRRYDIE
jgi:hypothetical protein